MTKSDELDDTMRVLSTGTCDTLSELQKLTYHIGCMPDGEIYLRVHSNTGGGFFSQEWISLRDILTALKKRPDGKPITSILLNPLFRGQVGQHAGVHDGGPAAREGGSFDAGKAPEARADGPIRIHGESREADGVRHQCEEQVLGKTCQKHSQKEIHRCILTQEVVTGKRESLSLAPAKRPHVSTRTSTGSPIHA